MIKVELIIDKKTDELGVFAVSIVNKPAIQKMFVKMSEETEKKVIKFAIDEEKKIITGPAMIPNILMYRSAGSIGLEEESMVYFSEESIKNAAEQFLALDVNNNVTLEHKIATTGLSLRESWIIEDPKCDKAMLYGFSDLPKGTWLLSYNVNDDAIWQEIKDGTYAGFSIEAYFIPRITNEVALSEETKDNFVISRLPGESDANLLGRCIGIEVGNGYDPAQAAAICHSKIADMKMEEFGDQFINLIKLYKTE